MTNAKTVIVDIPAGKLTFTLAKAILKTHNVNIVKRDGEYRVNVQGQRQAGWYYTNDLRDALLTGIHKANHDKL